MNDLKQLFGFEGKNVVISGSASGMSRAATELLLELGANVYSVDLNPVDLPVHASYRADLSKKEEIDAWMETLPASIDALFLCHGISQFPGREQLVQKVNFYSYKYITEKLLSRIADHGSISYIASVGGFGWQLMYKEALELINTSSWEEGMKWYEEHEDAYKDSAYPFAKKCLISYVMTKCTDPSFRSRRIRINCINPGDTVTGLTRDFNKSTGGGDEKKGADMIYNIFLKSWNGYSAQPKDMGYPLVVMGSNICSYMSGQAVYIDFGLTSEWTCMGLLKNKEEDVTAISTKTAKG